MCFNPQVSDARVISVFFKVSSVQSLKTEKDLISNVFCGYEYQFSSVNKEEVKCLTEELKSKKNRSIFHMYQYQDKEGTSCLSNMETDMAVQIEAPNIENERSISKEDTNKYNKDVICIDDGEDISEGETTIEQPAKRIKIEADFDTSEYGNHQTEVICKVTKDVFNNAAKLYLLKQIRLNVEALDESIISIFQAVIDKKVEIEGSDLEEFLFFVSINSKDLINSTKYGKFLLALITKYGKQMSVADVKVITEVVHCHGTFLKKSLESALKRLKPVL
ncbi:hypothetical protein KUTeg_022925 [Tegillarca granosa]|uniref:Fanconi Anaemia group E protein C-terminal domain-containing protein n=1 Tax=Tegillarca granosa TaxID=220873 RepID=A0ABQ9E160_TEGGR|nr:hypothetical protein KUTeg_022925 [Tegillarca granosa]